MFHQPHSMPKPGTDVDGTAKTEADHLCGEWFDMRDLDQVAKHIHDGDFEIGEAATDPP